MSVTIYVQINYTFTQKKKKISKTVYLHILMIVVIKTILKKSYFDNCYH